MTARWITTLVFVVCASDAWAQTIRPDPHMGYCYPAGGQRGTTVRVFVGGQKLNRVRTIHVTGDGVQARLVRYMGRVRRLDRNERLELVRRLRALYDARKGEGMPALPTGRRRGRMPAPAPEAGEVKLPRHPLLDDLDVLSKEEYEFVIHRFLRFDRKAQPNAQIAETVLIELTIDADAAPGDRELRLATPLGLTNPMCFQIGGLPEVLETQPYDTAARDPAPRDLPVVFNGQIKPGDVDRFAFRAEAGQKLVIAVEARHLVPFLADAVPGWFQATIALFDVRGKELAFVDDYHNRPDPVLLYEIPRAGVYRLEIRDAIYRGREDFVYRIRVGELPFITSAFPLGARAGSETLATVTGWNLGTTRLPLDTRPDGAAIRQTTLLDGGRQSNRVTYAVGAEPERAEAEPNDSSATAQPVELPVVVNGRIGRAGDRDVFRFEGRAGDTLVAEVHGRRLGSRIDSLVRVVDHSGTVLAWNDDAVDKVGHLHRDMGAITHHADSRVSVRLPANGTYRVELSDAQGQGGDDCAYRLYIGPPRAGFALYVTPSSLSLRPGLSAVVEVHALRHGGFDGPIDLRLAGAPAGFALAGGRMPASCDRIRVTVAAPTRALARPVSLTIEGAAQLGGQVVVRAAVPAENAMQAFLFRHLLPSQELVASVAGKRFRFPPPKLASAVPVEIAAGRNVQVRLRVPRPMERLPLHFVLRDPPKGLVLERTTIAQGVLTLFLSATQEAKPAGCLDNLIVEINADVGGRRGRAGKKGDSKGDSKRKRKKRQVFIGVLPAIPCRVVSP